MRYRDKTADDVLAYVAQYYRYDRNSGKFYHITSKAGTRSGIGDEAGHVNKKQKSHLIPVFSATIARYRLVWIMEHKEWPPGHLKHLDGNRYNDAISNLIPIKAMTVACEIKPRAKRKPGELPAGVTFMERRGQYRVDIQGRPPQYFDSLSQAQASL